MRTTCVSGLHPWGDDHTYIDSTGTRRCRPCRRATERRWEGRRARDRSINRKPRPGEERPFPVEPLLAYIERNQATGANAERIREATICGGFTIVTADRIAIQLGTHPGLIWPNWWIKDEEAS